MTLHRSSREWEYLPARPHEWLHLICAGWRIFEPERGLPVVGTEWNGSFMVVLLCREVADG